MFTTLRKSVASAIPTFRSSLGILRSTCLLALCLPHPLTAQQATPMVVPEGTPVHLRLAETVSSAHARVGDRLNFIVLQDVNVDGVTLIHAGAKAWGSVTKVRGKRPFGVPGRLTLQADSVELANGEKASLRNGMEFKGRRHLVRMAAGMIVTGLIYLPAAPAMLLTRGGDSVALKTSETTAFLEGNLPVLTAGLPRATPPPSGLDEISNFLPPRVFDARGREGDMVNLVFVAPAAELQQAFESAGWTSVDQSKHMIAWHLLCHGTHYARLPMAHFFLFGRSQDFSFSMPDPTFILSRRHHIRIWKTDYLVNNTPVWIAAATHDVSIAVHHLHVTHNIDPQVDAERDFIGDNLSGTRLVARSEYLSSQQPVFQATTAGGQAYYSDSRILLVQLAQLSSPAPASAASTASSATPDPQSNEPQAPLAASLTKVSAKTPSGSAALPRRP